MTYFSAKRSRTLERLAANYANYADLIRVIGVIRGQKCFHQLTERFIATARAE
jgi:hypothetical protein